jgi:hypothetical protein
MISPSPTQQPPKAPTPERKEVKLTPLRRRLGETPGARFVKAIFRPLFKGIYYTIQFTRTRKLISFIALLLLLASISVTSFFSTGLWPFGIGNDQFNFHVHGTSGGGEAVKNWLYALRKGDVSTLKLLEADMSSPPDPTQLVSQFGETPNGRQWTTITVLGVSSEADSTIDSFVEVDTTSKGPGGATDGMIVFHFVTFVQSKEYLLGATPIDFRKPLR